MPGAMGTMVTWSGTTLTFAAVTATVAAPAAKPAGIRKLSCDGDTRMRPPGRATPVLSVTFTVTLPSEVGRGRGPNCVEEARVDPNKLTCSSAAKLDETPLAELMRTGISSALEELFT